MSSTQLPHLQPINSPLLTRKGVELWVQREDLVHPRISGNKWYKLKYNIEQAVAQGAGALLSFGGAYSNHLHALAYAGKVNGLKTVGVVRGELIQPLNPTLQDAVDWGMELLPVSRSDYQRRHNAEFQQQLAASFEPCVVIPEGGANALALKGCAEIAVSVRQQLPAFDYLCVACGTGATLAGLITGMQGHAAKVLGFCTLKGLQDLEPQVTEWLTGSGVDDLPAWQIEHRFHCGGFAKINRELVLFMEHWKTFSDIPLEPLYTGKMFYGLFQMIEQGYFRAGDRIVAVHTGGLQGLRGMQAKMDKLLAGS